MYPKHTAIDAERSFLVSRHGHLLWCGHMLFLERTRRLKESSVSLPVCQVNVFQRKVGGVCVRLLYVGNSTLPKQQTKTRLTRKLVLYLPCRFRERENSFPQGNNRPKGDYPWVSYIHLFDEGTFACNNSYDLSKQFNC